jgi:hypothetical protein
MPKINKITQSEYQEIIEDMTDEEVLQEELEDTENDNASDNNSAL